MCGIAGFNFKVDNEYVLKKLYHRGPDEQGVYEDGNFSFFHTRLAIQDIKGGHQPFFYKNYMIVFNGEIYNHLDLRKNLNVNWMSNSDAETLLHLYLQYGENMFDAIDGMFAFAIYDKKKKKLFLARDRAGKKPLYIYQKGNKFGFASEINVFKFLDLDIDGEDIRLFLSTGFCESGYKEIKEFPPGHYGYFDGELDIKSYFNIIDFYSEEKIALNDGIELVENNLITAVKNRIISSDVEVGAFLSGGIDSGLVVAVASKYTKLRTFTVRFNDQFDESELAKLTAKKYDMENIVIDVKIDFSEIRKIILNYGKPFFDSSAIPSYFVSKEAGKYVKVILNGDGADEIFAGYRRYLPSFYYLDKFAYFFKFLLPFFKADYRGARMFIYRLIRAASKKGINWYNVLLNDLLEDVYEIKGTKIVDIDNFIKEMNFNEFEKLLILDFLYNLRYDLLPKMDIATMSNSLEGRSPFLSKYMLETAPRIKTKIRHFQTKYILRTIAKKYLPQEVVNAKKRGFEIPLTKWVNNELKEMIMDYLNYGFYKNFIDKKLVDDLINRKINLPEDKRAKILYLLFSLELWKVGK